jgi:predicted PurR-regulated permease PerM
VTASLFAAQKVLIPLALAVLLSFILSPSVSWLQHRGLRRVPAVVLVVILAFAFLGAIGLGLTTQLRSLVDELPSHRDNIRTKIQALPGMRSGSIFSEIDASLQSITEGLIPGQSDTLGTAGKPMVVRVEASWLEHIQGALGPVSEGLAAAGLVIILVVFMLIFREDLRNRLVRLLGHGRLIHTTRALDEAAHRISRYLIVQVLINAAFALILCLGLTVFGVPYALLWGILGGTLRFVPYVGTWLAATALLLFCLAFLPGWKELVMVAIFWLVLELATSQIAEPLVIGHSTGVSAVALLVSAAFWTWLWGPIGLVLSTPLTVCLVVLGKYVPQMEFLGILLGDEPVLRSDLSYYQRLLARDQDEATDLVEEHLRSKPLETVYDDLLLPALVLAERDRDRGELSSEDEQFIFQVTRDILDDLLFRQQQLLFVAEHGPAALSPDDKKRALVVGCPAHHEADELALHMFAQMLDPTICRVEIFPSGTLSAEVVEKVGAMRPAVVCIAALPPAGAAQVRYLCKRLRAQYADLKLIVGRWGQSENVEAVVQRLREAGADFVGTTLLETRDHALPLLQTAGPPNARKAI